MIVSEQSRLAELERLLLDVMGQCAALSLNIRKLVEVENFAHPEVRAIEAHLFAAGRVACGIDARLFDNPCRGMSGRLH